MEKSSLDILLNMSFLRSTDETKPYWLYNTLRQVNEDRSYILG